MKNTDGGTIATGTTDTNGKITWTGAPLTYGESYTIEQTSVKEGFKKADPINVTIDKALTEVSIKNGQFASLEITLYETGTTKPLSGGTFIIKDENYNIIGTAKTTGADGKVTFTGLEDGKNYIIEQTAAPTGYVPIEPKQYLQDGIVFYQPIFNTAGTTNVSSIKITAVDNDTATKFLAGAEFKVTGPNGAIYNVTTNSNGVAILTNLPNGTYTIVQTKAPNGYLSEGKSITQTLTNQAGELTVKNIYIGEEAGILDPAIIKVTVYERDQNGALTGNVIAGATLRATDNLGNVYYATSNANGVLYFSGLNITRTYTIEAYDAPYIYGDGPWPGANISLGFTDLTTPFYREAMFYLNKAETQTLYINVFEKGDNRVRIGGAQVELTYPNGTTRIFTTDANGVIIISGLPKDFEYTVRQLTTDATHDIDPTPQTIYLLRPETIDFLNPLKNPAAVTKNITVNKVWGDPKPATLSSIEFKLYADGQLVETKSMSGTATQLTFNNKPKYDVNHGTIKYTIEETPIPNYYSVMEKTDTDGYAWKVTNYQGYQVGTCSNGTYWMSNSSTAYEYNPNGSKTGRTINLGSTFGY